MRINLEGVERKRAARFVPEPDGEHVMTGVRWPLAMMAPDHAARMTRMTLRRDKEEAGGFIASGKRAENEWAGAESNCRHCDFQSHALPTELPRRGGRYRTRTCDLLGVNEAL